MGELAIDLQGLVAGAVPRVADACALEVVTPVRALVTAHVDPAARARLEAACRYRPGVRRGTFGLGRVLATGRPEVCFAIDRDHLRAMAEDDAHFDLLEALGVSASITLPLVVSGEVAGALMLLMTKSARAHEPGGEFEPHHLTAVNALARAATERLALALVRRSSDLPLTSSASG